MQVIGVQLDIVWEDPAANHAKVRSLLAAAPPRAGALVVLPEMFASGFSMNAAGVASCPIMSAKEAAEDPHYRARGIHVEWEDEQVGPLKGVGMVPKFSKTPQKIWRGSGRLGADNQKVYGELLGYTDADLAAFAAKGVV